MGLGGNGLASDSVLFCLGSAHLEERMGLGGTWSALYSAEEKKKVLM